MPGIWYQTCFALHPLWHICVVFLADIERQLHSNVSNIERVLVFFFVQWHRTFFFFLFSIIASVVFLFIGIVPLFFFV